MEIGWIIVGLLVAIAVALNDIRKELVRFRMHFDSSSLSNYDQKNLISLVGSMHEALAEIRINTGRR